MILRNISNWCINHFYPSGFLFCLPLYQQSSYILEGLPSDYIWSGNARTISKPHIVLWFITSTKWTKQQWLYTICSEVQGTCISWQCLVYQPLLSATHMSTAPSLSVSCTYGSYIMDREPFYRNRVNVYYVCWITMHNWVVFMYVAFV